MTSNADELTTVFTAESAGQRYVRLYDAWDGSEVLVFTGHPTREQLAAAYRHDTPGSVSYAWARVVTSCPDHAELPGGADECPPCAAFADGQAWLLDSAGWHEHIGQPGWFPVTYWLLSH